VNKAENLRQIYRKKYTVAGFLLGPLVGARVPKREEDWQELLDMAYHCNNCGHCYTTCTQGIDSGRMIQIVRYILNKNNRTPKYLRDVIDLEATKGYLTVQGFQDAWKSFLDEARQVDPNLTVGRKGAKVLLGLSMFDALFNRDAAVSAVKILSKAGEDYTLPERPLGLRPPLGMVAGDFASAASVINDVFDYVESLGVGTLAIIDGGNSFPNMRFESTNLVRRVPKFEIKHFVELLAEYVKSGKIKVKKTDEEVTYHDPCQLARRSGIMEEPREVIRAMTSNFKESKYRKLDTLCVGGAGTTGCVTRSMYETIYKLSGKSFDSLDDGTKSLFAKLEKDGLVALRRRIEDLAKTGAKRVLTLCPVAEALIRDGSAIYGESLLAENLIVYVARNLE
jgi:Fe-S oxidoreductase